MMKKLTLIIFCLLATLHVFGASPFTLRFSTTDLGNNPNTLVAFITTSTGAYVDTIGVYGSNNKYIGELTSWRTTSGITSFSAAPADAKMGATRSNFSTPNPVVFNWDLKNSAGNVVPDGTYTIRISNAHEGTDSSGTFSFVKDGNAGTRTVANFANFTGISVVYDPPVANTAPVANAQSVSTAEDTAKAITLTATDAESNPMTYAIASNPSHGSLSGTAPSVTYTPAANYYGADSFTFTARDASLTSTPATVSITVTAVNDAPVALAQNPTATDGNALPITLAATDVETNSLTYHVVSQPGKGHLTGTPPSLTYVPPRGVNGSGSFTFNAFDGMATGNTATVSISLVFIDSSSNGIPNSWQSAYGVTDANADPDGDGATNYEEYMAGTNPTNGTSVFAANGPLSGVSNPVIQWNSSPYRYYSVQATTNLVDGWITVSSNNPATPPVNTYTGAVSRTGFYRIQIDP